MKTFKEPLSIKNIYAYLQGNIRYYLFYHKYLYKLIPLHIFEQIEWRILKMDKSCYALGSCKLCGCQTTALQMANKSCKKPCYPKMMKKNHWKFYKECYAETKEMVELINLNKKK